MRLLTRWLACAMALVAAHSRVGAADNSSVQQELTLLEQAWNEAHIQGNVDVLDRLWANEITVIVPGMPVFNKARSLGIWKSGHMKFARYETSELKFVMESATSVVTGRLIRERVVEGKVLTDDWRFTKVYIKRDGRWQVVAWHASPVSS